MPDTVVEVKLTRNSNTTTTVYAPTNILFRDKVVLNSVAGQVSYSFPAYGASRVFAIEFVTFDGSEVDDDTYTLTSNGLGNETLTFTNASLITAAKRIVIHWRPLRLP